MPVRITTVNFFHASFKSKEKVMMTQLYFPNDLTYISTIQKFKRFGSSMNNIPSRQGKFRTSNNNYTIRSAEMKKIGTLK
jgi:hypothetical protein